MKKDLSIDYVEFPAADMEAAKSFYQKVFGWSFTDYGEDYCSFEDARLEGGFYRADKSSKTSAGAGLVVFYTVDLEAARQKVMDAGGTIALDIISFPGGRRFQFLDPNGNELGIWSDK